MTKAIIEKTDTTIDGKTGDVTVTKKGKAEGFGRGLQEFIRKGVSQKIGADIRVGQLPPGHTDEGKWAVQVNILAFDSKVLADKFAEQATPIIEGMLGAKALVQQ